MSLLACKKNNEKVAENLDKIRQYAKNGNNLMPAFVEAVREYASLGEICNVLRQEFGEYRENIIL